MTRASCSVSEVGVLSANLANAGELLDSFAVRNQLQNVGEALLQECSVESRSDHILACLGRHHRELYELHSESESTLNKTYIWEELTLVDADYIELLPDVADIRELGGTYRAFLDSISTDLLVRQLLTLLEIVIHQTPNFHKRAKVGKRGTYES